MVQFDNSHTSTKARRIFARLSSFAMTTKILLVLRSTCGLETLTEASKRFLPRTCIFTTPRAQLLLSEQRKGVVGGVRDVHGVEMWWWWWWWGGGTVNQPSLGLVR